MRYVSESNGAELVAVLNAYEHMVRRCWPDVHPGLSRRRAGWATATVSELERTVGVLMHEADSAQLPLRVFWKHLPDYTFWGGSTTFASDAGLTSMSQLFGLTDFSNEVPWNRQAPLYRKDDEEVIRSGRDKLDIIQRQDQTSGTIYLHAAKVPIFDSDRKIVGLMGAYTRVDAATAARIVAKKSA